MKGEMKLQEEKVCIECGEQFVFTEGEQKFYADKGFAPPKRCSMCRRNRKTIAKTVEAELNKKDKNKGGN